MQPNVIVLRLLPPPRYPRTLALLIVLALAAAAGCGGSSPPHKAVARHGGMISIFEAPTELLNNPAGALAQLQQLGVQYVRVMVPWRSLAPDPSSSVAPANFNASSPAAYPAANWAPYDAIVRDARLRHVGIMFNVTGGAPQWATGPGFVPGGAPGVWRPSPSKFGDFVRAVGTRYDGAYRPPGASSALPRISLWSIWNEPNLGQANLAPQTIAHSTIESSAAIYRQLLDAGWTALHRSGHDHDAILIGELAPFGQTIPATIFPGTFGEMVPLRFVRALYCVDSSLRPLRGPAAAARGCPTTAAAAKSFGTEHPALFDATGFAVHPYPGPTRLPPNTLLPGSPDFANLAALPKLEQLLRTVTNRYGRGRSYPLWNTEDGYITDPPYPPGAPLAVAAAYENWAEYISWRNPLIRSWDHYLLVDPPVGGPSHFFSGLEFSDRSPKPTYAAYRLPIYLPVTGQPRGGNLEVWGCVRPVYHQTAPQHAEIQLKPTGGGTFRTVRSVKLTDASCYFDVRVAFSSGGQVRLAWSYPGGPTVYSRLVGVTTS
jgi:hypothetical protein